MVRPPLSLRKKDPAVSNADGTNEAAHMGLLCSVHELSI